MKCINKESMNKKSYRERGYSMLEYAAGAAIILAILYGAMNLLEGGVTNLFSSISEWATSHGDHLRNQKPTP